MNPVLLDLYCCEGGAAVGYGGAGFDVYGVDSEPRVTKRYPFPTMIDSALVVLDELLAGRPVQFSDEDCSRKLRLRDIAAVHASPPCQHASAGTRAVTDRARKYPALIEPTRERLIATGKPYVIENVKGSALIDPLTLCGTEFGLTAIDDDGTPLEMWRHRGFESNVPLRGAGGCRHHAYSRQVAGVYGGARRDKHEARNVRHGGYVPSARVQSDLLGGVDWMTQHGMAQSIPPAYAEHVGVQLSAVVS